MEELIVLKDFYDLEEIEEWVEKQKSNILIVAEENGFVIGFLYAKIVSSQWCMLESLGVDKAYRGKGIGTRLVDHLYGVLKERKIDYVQALVGEEHPISREFWKRKGFKEGKKFIWIEKDI